MAIKEPPGNKMSFTFSSRVLFSFCAVSALGLGLLSFPWLSSSTRHPSLQPHSRPQAAAGATRNQVSGAAPAKKRGNRFARIFTTPFRGLAGLFSNGSGRDKDIEKGINGKTIIAKAEVEGIANKSVGKAGAASPPLQQSKGIENASRAASITRRGTLVSGLHSGGSAVLPIEHPAIGRWNPMVAGVSLDHISQGRALIERGHLNEAIAELSIAATTGTNLLEANNLLGVAYSRRGWHKLAVECYERALIAAPEDAQTLANLGHTLYLAGRHEAALKRLNQAAKSLPNSPYILHSIGLAQSSLGRFEDAYKSFARADGEFDGRVRVAGILESVGRDKEAIKHYEAALRLQPNSSVALQHLAGLYQRNGHLDKAEVVRRTLSKPPGKEAAVTGGGG
jgi:Flp pilus assembly protein TadD